MSVSEDVDDQDTIDSFSRASAQRDEAATTDPAKQEPPIKWHQYFARNSAGAIVQLPMQSYGPTVMTAPQIDAVYAQLVAKKGLGVPRPTHYAVHDLVALPLKQPTLIQPPGPNGNSSGVQALPDDDKPVGM